MRDGGFSLPTAGPPSLLPAITSRGSTQMTLIIGLVQGRDCSEVPATRIPFKVSPATGGSKSTGRVDFGHALKHSWCLFIKIHHLGVNSASSSPSAFITWSWCSRGRGGSGALFTIQLGSVCWI